MLLRNIYCTTRHNVFSVIGFTFSLLFFVCVQFTIIRLQRQKLSLSFVEPDENRTGLRPAQKVDLKSRKEYTVLTMKRSSSSMELRSYKRQNCPNGNSNMQPVESESEINIPVESECEFNMVDDLLTEIIFKFVPMCQWSSCLEYVSKQFQRCVYKAYSRIKFINFKTLFSLKLSSNNLEMTRSLLIVSKQVVITARLNNILQKLLLVCPNITGIAGFEYVTRSLCAESVWNSLKKFDHLQSISFDGASGIKFKYLHDFVVGQKSLKNLNISDCSFYDSGTLDISTLSSVVNKTTNKIIFLENLTEKLTALTIDSFQCSFKSAVYAIQALKLCVNLESLSVYIDNIGDYKILFNVLAHLCKLTELRVSGWWMQIDAANAFGEQFCTQMDLIKKQLKSVEFQWPTNALLGFLVTECFNLQSLKLSCTSSLSINVLEKFSLPGKLKELTFSDDDGQILPLLLPHLVQLSTFTDLTVNVHGDFLSEEWENISRLVHLRNLRLYGGVIDDSVLEKWDKKNDKMFENLVTLEIPHCQGISDVGACLFAKKAKNVENLDLSSSQIGDKTISILADVAKKLTRANFCSCALLRDEKAFLDFIKKSVCLKKLQLDYLLAKKVVAHKDFMPFVESVEIINVD